MKGNLPEIAASESRLLLPWKIGGLDFRSEKFGGSEVFLKFSDLRFAHRRGDKVTGWVISVIDPKIRKFTKRPITLSFNNKMEIVDV